MSTYDPSKALPTLDLLIEKLTPLKDINPLNQQFLLECIWFRQQLQEGTLQLPLDSFRGYVLSSVILDVPFEGTEIQSLVSTLAESMQDNSWLDED